MKNFVKYIALFVVIASLLVLSVACGTPEPEHFQDTVELEVGDTMTVKPNEGFYALYVYETSDENIVSVDNSGCVKALSEGTATVTIKRDDVVIASYNFTVSENTFVAPADNVAPTSYRLAPSKNDVVVYIGGSVDVEVSVFKDEYASDEKAIYSSLNEEVATVQPIDGGVKIKAVASGKTSVKAKIGGFEAVISVKVYDRSVTPLPAPIINGFTDSTISWTSVADASGYNVSVNNGVTWSEVQGATYEYEGNVNPLAVRVIAIPELSTNSESEPAVITVDNLQIAEGKGIKLLEEYTVAGNINTVGRTQEVALYVVFGNQKTKVADEFVTFSVKDENVITLNDDNIAVPVSRGSTTITARLKGGSVVCEGAVGTPISTREDLEALAYAKRDGKPELWDRGTRYIFTNDIDYAGADGRAKWYERYLTPIATERAFTNDSGLGHSWGIFGDLKSGSIFYGAIDGNGFAIKNAVMPLGIAFETAPYKFIMCQNFIGLMAYKAELKNLAFINLQYETPIQITYNNPYYKATNTALAGTIFETDGIPYNEYGNYLAGDGAQGVTIHGGIVGRIANALIENIYVEAKIRNTVWSSSYNASALIVGMISKDDLVNVPQTHQMESQVRGCVVKTVYDANPLTNTWYGAMQIENNYVKKFGAFVGYNEETKATTINNCYAISATNGTDIAVTNDQLVVFKAGEVAGTDIGIYDSAAALMSAQGAKAREFFIWNRVNG